MINIDKELAFLDLAVDVLKFSRGKRAFIREMILEYNQELSPKFWEKVIEKIGKIKYIDDHYMDFSDGSEAKTSSTFISKSGVKGNISNVSGKTGHIRVACYNTWKKNIDYFLMPTNHKCTVSYTKSRGNKGNIHFSYNRTLDTYSNNLDKYRVKNIKEVCRRKK